MDKTKKTILLTGGSGFIGRNLREYLESKYAVLSPSHTELELLNQCAVRDFLRNNRVDVVIHSATVPSHRKAKNIKDIAYKNLRIFYNLARNERHFSRMIFLGSGAEYGAQQDIVDAKEFDFDKFVPEDEHGFSKYVCSKYIEKSDNIVNLRLFGIFGKYEDYQIRFISNVICKSLFNIPITIKQNRLFSYLFADDLGMIVEYFIENRPREKIYNVVPDYKMELLALARKVNEISGKNLEIRVGSPGMGKEYTGNNSRLVEEIKEIKFTPIDVAIAKLYGWYDEHKRELDTGLLFVDP